MFMNKFILIAFLIVVLDQITKVLFLDVHVGVINYTTNTGAAFSLFQDSVFILSLISFAVLLFIVYFYRKHPKLVVPLAFLFGGTIGNLIDRVFLGHVRDFIDLKVWPIFNVADSFNVIGAIVLVYFVWKNKI
jgi:signal peptidase II